MHLFAVQSYNFFLTYANKMRYFLRKHAFFLPAPTFSCNPCNLCNRYYTIKAAKLAALTLYYSCFHLPLPTLTILPVFFQRESSDLILVAETLCPFLARRRIRSLSQTYCRLFLRSSKVFQFLRSHKHQTPAPPIG